MVSCKSTTRCTPVHRIFSWKSNSNWAMKRVESLRSCMTALDRCSTQKCPRITLLRCQGVVICNMMSFIVHYTLRALELRKTQISSREIARIPIKLHRVSQRTRYWTQVSLSAPGHYKSQWFADQMKNDEDVNLESFEVMKKTGRRLVSSCIVFHRILYAVV